MKCLDEVTLQGYFDGELSHEVQPRAAAHVASCSDCAAALLVIEAETTAIANAFAYQEMTDVPTERLRERLDEAISGLGVESSPATSAPCLRELFSRLIRLEDYGVRGRRTAFAGLAVAVAVIMLTVVLANLHTSPTSISSSSDPTPSQPMAVREPSSEQAQRAGDVISQTAGLSETNTHAAAPRGMVKSNVVRLASASRGLASVGSAPVNQPRTVAAKAARRTVPSAVRDVLLPGEKNYLDAIASFETAVDTSGDSPLPASLRAEYERNLDVVDEAIAATRRTAATDPTDTVAADFLRRAYESKIELLSSLTIQVGETRKGSPSR